VSALFRKLKLPKGAGLHSLRYAHGCPPPRSGNGVDLIDVSARLGHSSIYTTATVYAHAIHGRDEEAAKKWEEFQKQATRSEGASPSKPI
jgi:integrase